jgi:DNA repair photolyase
MRNQTQAPLGLGRLSGNDAGISGQTSHHRGASSNPDGRFEPLQRDAVDDGWWREDDLPPLRTSLGIDTARSVITRNQSPDIPFDRSINPYRGCEHGCIYCYARPSHAYLGLSPGLDFESRLFAKPDAARLLAAELRRPSYRCAPIAIGTNTDPYQPIENRQRIMRSILEVLVEFGHPLTITTKSALILRDLDLLERMAARKLVQVAVSITTLDRGLARILEPRASVPEKRLAAIGRLAEAGIPVMVNVAPVIPAVTVHEMEAILGAAATRGASAASWILLRLPGEVALLFDQWLGQHLPARRNHVISLLKQSRRGLLNDPSFHGRFSGSGPYAELIGNRFRQACRRLGLGRLDPLTTSLFAPPPRPGDQLTLFD